MEAVNEGGGFRETSRLLVSGGQNGQAGCWSERDDKVPVIPMGERHLGMLKFY